MYYVERWNGDTFVGVEETDPKTWAAYFASERRIVARTATPGGDVSTVFLGLGHGHDAHHPQLYETMVFTIDATSNLPTPSEYQVRYATRAEALAGHAYAVHLHTPVSIMNAEES